MEEWEDERMKGWLDENMIRWKDDRMKGWMDK